MSRVYRAVMGKISGPVKGVFLDTPAGFQLNADEISARAVAYFCHHFQIELGVASFKNAREAGEGEREEAVARIEAANFILAGPGSPTYTVRNWLDSPLLEALHRRLAGGAHLVFASAAAIAASSHALPVYEIYKVGEDPHWVRGIDILGSCGLELAVMPHWNNAEGGTHDTRFCFMGEPRLRLLERQLPASALILGIDEYTACLIDLARHECRVMGAGGIVLRWQGRERTFSSGTIFSLEELRVGARGEGPGAQQQASGADRATEQAAVSERLRKLLGKSGQLLWNRGEKEMEAVVRLAYLLDLARTVERARKIGMEGDLLVQAEERLREAMGVGPIGPGSPSSPSALDPVPLLELLIEVRSRLRQAREWGLADEIRQRLTSLGVILEDRVEGTHWRLTT
jgi:hypothetical protein